jgi:hypothetical protein
VYPNNRTKKEERKGASIKLNAILGERLGFVTASKEPNFT